MQKSIPRAATLFAWIGKADLDSSAGTTIPGPILMAIQQCTPQSIQLISCHNKSESCAYVQWLQTQTKTPVLLHHCSLPDPTNIPAIWKSVGSIVQSLPDTERIYHLTPGTPAMATVWMLLSLVHAPGTLVQTSLQNGLQLATLPDEFRRDVLSHLIDALDTKRRIRSSNSVKLSGFDAILHRSPVMENAIGLAKRIAKRSLTLLLLGESGTGKELFAQAIHDASNRSQGPFLALNCGALSPELVESELFGHAKGAFTGAHHDHIGLMEQAKGGTLFLDEIGDLPLALQVKLLRALQERRIRPVGSIDERTIDIRIIAATHKDLQELSCRGLFRNDLLHRLTESVLTLPALRDRGEDLNMLIGLFWDRVQQEAQEDEGYRPRPLGELARHALLQHPWPGNVRELENTLRRLTVLPSTQQLDHYAVQSVLLTPPQRTENGKLIEVNLPLEQQLDEISRSRIQKALTDCHQHRGNAAKQLGFANHQTLANWIKRLGIEVSQ